MTTIPDENVITDCKLEEKEVGKAFKSTKRKYRWEFKINETSHWVELYDSKLSGKKKVIADGVIVLQPKVIRNAFSFTFNLDKNVVAINQNGSTFDCKVNNFALNTLLGLQKSKSCNDGFSPACTNNKTQSQGALNNDFSKFKLEDSYNIDNKENASNNQNFNFAIKSTDGPSEVDQSNNPLYKFDKKKIEEFYQKSGQHSNSNKEAKVNLLDFDDNLIGRPSSVNIMDISPFLAPTTFEQKEDNRQNAEPTNNRMNELNNINFTNPVNNIQNNTASIETKEKKPENVNDINALFDIFSVGTEKPKEASKVDQVTEMYRRSFTSGSPKVDPIMNVFGGPSFSRFASMNLSLCSDENKDSYVLNCPTNGSQGNSNNANFTLDKQNNMYNKSNSDSANPTLYPTFDDPKVGNVKSQGKKKNAFDLFDF